MPKYYIVKEVAEIFRRSEKTILRWLDEGKIFHNDKILKVKDGYLIPVDEVERIVSENTMTCKKNEL